MSNGLKLRVYDSVDEYPLDRYTVVFTGRYRHKTGGMYIYMGTCQKWGEHWRQIDAPSGWAPAIGHKCHLGRRITFEELPEYFQREVMKNYNYLWDLEDVAN